MFNRLSLLSACAALLLAGTAAEAVTLRYANQGDLKSLDPYTLNETTTNSHLGHVYEGLTKRGKDLSIEPGLAERWETSEDGLTWRFYLRKNVKFHNGNPFTADDVVFSANRVRAQGSNFQTRVPTDAEFVKVDDYTVDVKLKTPNPIMNYQWDTWYIMDKEWAEANNAAAPTPASAQTPSFAALNTNGTGPFRIESHQPGVKTVFKKNSTGGARSSTISTRSSSRRSARMRPASRRCCPARSTSSSRCRSRTSSASTQARTRRC